MGLRRGIYLLDNRENVERKFLLSSRRMRRYVINCCPRRFLSGMHCKSRRCVAKILRYRRVIPCIATLVLELHSGKPLEENLPTRKFQMDWLALIQRIYTSCLTCKDVIKAFERVEEVRPLYI